MTEHEQKYESKAQWLGVENLKTLLQTSCSVTKPWRRVFGPITNDRVQLALDRGDEHLNTIPLHIWDSKHDAVVALVHKTLKGGTIKKTTWSLCDSVCVLKHVAKHHLTKG